MTKEAFEWEQCAARIEHLILIPAAIGQGEGCYPAAFSDEFCENLPERADAPLYKQVPALAKFADGEDWPDASEVAEALYFGRCTGFLIQAAQPVMTAFYPTGGYSYSWGYYHTEWLYAATADAISAVVDAWSDEALARDRAKFETEAVSA